MTITLLKEYSQGMAKTNKKLTKKTSSKTSTKSKAKKVHSAAKRNSNHRAVIGVSAFAILMLIATHVQVSTPLYANTSFWGSVLGDEDNQIEHREEERRPEEHREEERRPEERRPEERRPEENKPDHRPEQERKLEDRRPDQKGPDDRKPIDNQNRLRREDSKQDLQNGELERRRIDDPRDKKEFDLDHPNEKINEPHENDERPEDNPNNFIDTREHPFELTNEMRIKHERDIRTQDGQRIRTKVEDDGTQKIEVEGRDYKLKYVFRDGRLRARAENEAGEEIDVPNEATAELEDLANSELEAEGIRIDRSVDRPGIIRNGFKAHSKLPISINPLTNNLVINTPEGDKDVAVLPDQAIANLLDTGVVTELDESTEAGEESGLNGSAEIVERNNKLVYKIKGTRRHKVFGFIPFNQPVTAYVSTEDGSPIEKEQSIFANVIDAISL